MHDHCVCILAFIVVHILALLNMLPLNGIPQVIPLPFHLPFPLPPPSILPSPAPDPQVRDDTHSSLFPLTLHATLSYILFIYLVGLWDIYKYIYIYIHIYIYIYIYIYILYKGLRHLSNLHFDLTKGKQFPLPGLEPVSWCMT